MPLYSNVIRNLTAPVLQRQQPNWTMMGLLITPIPITPQPVKRNKTRLLGRKTFLLRLPKDVGSPTTLRVRNVTIGNFSYHVRIWNRTIYVCCVMLPVLAQRTSIKKGTYSISIFIWIKCITKASLTAAWSVIQQHMQSTKCVNIWTRKATTTWE